MTFRTLRSTFSCPSWLQVPQELIQHRGVLKMSKSESRSLQQEGKDAIDNNRSQDAENALYAGLLLDEEQFLFDLRKSGILRISRFSYDSEPLTTLVSSLLKPDLGFSPSVQAYLQSISNLYQVAAFVRVEHQHLCDWLSHERERGIRGLLGTLDWLFLKRTFEPCWADPSLLSRNPFFHSSEKLADGLSAILALYFNEFGDLRGNVVIDAEAAVAGRYLDYLVAGAHLAEFREWESLVDRFGYHLETVSTPNRFTLRAPSEELLRSLEYGYIQDYMQRVAKNHQWHDSEAQSFVEIGRSFSDRCLTYIDKPIPRYRFEFPDFLFEKVAWVKQFTQEERKTIAWACREMSVSVEDLFAFNFGNGVTINDLFRVSRVISFMHGVAASKLCEVAAERLDVVFNSLVLAIPGNDFLDIIERAIGVERAETVLELLTVKPTGHVDILYTPLVSAGDRVFLPVHLFSQSNIFRNPLMVTQQRLFPDGTFDPLTNQIGTSFEKAGAKVTTNLPFSWDGKVGECDVLALIEDHLFVCECKNSLLPTGVHELRTSLDHVEKAARQLKLFEACFTDLRFRSWLTKTLGCEITETTKLIPSIIVSNRMFLGLRPDGIPVRGNQELDHFIESGVFEFVDTGVIESSNKEVHLWNGSTLTVEDLRCFFEEDITYKPHWDSMERFNSCFQFDECVVEVPRLRINVIALAGNFGLADVKRKMIEMAKEDGLPIDDEGWTVWQSEDDEEQSLETPPGEEEDHNESTP